MRQSIPADKLPYVFRGRELTCKDRRLPSGLAPIDALLGGGVARGRVTEILGQAGSGKTSLAACFVAEATGRGEVAAWVDSAGEFDPASMAKAGADLSRLLWAYQPDVKKALKAAELILMAGGFGVLVLDLDPSVRPLAQSAALRVARAAERSGAAVLVLAANRMCGTFAAQSIVLTRSRPHFSRARRDGPALFDGLRGEARMARNKLGGVGHCAAFEALADAGPQAVVADDEAGGGLRDVAAG